MMSAYLTPMTSVLPGHHGMIDKTNGATTFAPK